MVADDTFGLALLDHARDSGIDISRTKIVGNKKTIDNENGSYKTNNKQLDMKDMKSTKNTDLKTATYTAVHDYDGSLITAIADTRILSSLTPDMILALTDSIQHAKLVVVDGNLSDEAFSTLIHVCKYVRTPVFFEPTSDVKCVLPITTKMIQSVCCDLCLQCYPVICAF